MSSNQEITAPLIQKKQAYQAQASASGFPDDPSGVENSPIEQVALTVPVTDDPSLPTFTFRTLVLGTLACVLLSFLNQFFWYRREPLSITSISAQIAVVPLGHLMASTITDRVFFKGRRWEFTLNPGPFNVKEHVLITIFANSGAGNVYAIHIVSAVKLFYKRNMTFVVALLVVITTQVLGFGWAGLFRRYLVEPAAMWWPQNLVQVSLFRALHEKEKRPKGELTRNQFFLIAFICSFAYYVLPGYLFSMLTSISWICWLFPTSILAQQLGSGLHGLGVGAFGFDWSTISSYLGSPLASPWFATANIAAGFILVMYVITPIAYWLNIYNAKTFPIFSDGLFTSTGQSYNISAIIDANFSLNIDAYEQKGPLHLSTFFAMYYGINFACLSATVVHVFLFHGREMWQLSKSALQEKRMDVHTKLMRKYKQVPQWWFMCILSVNIVATLFTCQYYNNELQLPWWGVLLACCLALFFTLPVGVITATTNQTPALNVITEYLIGYLYPEHPIANICFKVYGYISMKQGIAFLEDFKLGHYMKIPPRSMFVAQVVGTVVAAFVHLGTAWWLMDSIPNICDRALLPAGSPWTCPSDHVFYDASVVWGLIGPRRIFGDLGRYSAINWFFLVGAIAPLLVWLAHKAFPDKYWIRLITMPVILGATVNMPPATAVNFTSWILIGFVSGFIVYRYHRDWWSRHNYVLSGALDAGFNSLHRPKKKMVRAEELLSGKLESGTHISISKRKKIFLALFATLLLVAAIVGLVAGVNSRKKSGDNEVLSASHVILKSSCSSTLYPDLCYASLATVPGAVSKLSSQKDVIEASLNLTTKAVEHNFRAVEKLTKRKNLTKREKVALHDCLETIDETLDELHKAVEDLHEYPNKKSLSLHADDLKTLISAAITNQETCLDGFSHDDADKHVREALLDGQVHVERMCSNALAMIKNMTDTDIANENKMVNRKLMEAVDETKWPEWLSAADRRLLQSSSVTPNVVVAADGSGDYKTVSAAVAAAPDNSKTRYIIRIKAGKYSENVEVTKKKKNIMFLGDDRRTTIITGNRNVVDGSTTFNSATVAVVGEGFLARDITFENTAGHAKHQAVALRVGADLSAFYRCDMLAYQDTLYVHSNRQFYVGCLIAGTVDFIFGNAAAVLQDCDIHARRPGSGQKNMVTAQGRTDPNQNTGIVIQKCRIGATSDLLAVKSSFPTYLGRPWKEYSRTVIMQSSISDVIHPDGWHIWSGTFALDTLFYGEYQNTGLGAEASGRVTWKGFKVITSATEAQAYTPGTFIAASSWLGSTGFPFSLGL